MGLSRDFEKGHVGGEQFHRVQWPTTTDPSSASAQALTHTQLQQQKVESFSAILSSRGWWVKPTPCSSLCKCNLIIYAILDNCATPALIMNLRKNTTKDKGECTVQSSRALKETLGSPRQGTGSLFYLNDWSSGVYSCLLFTAQKHPSRMVTAAFSTRWFSISKLFTCISTGYIPTQKAKKYLFALQFWGSLNREGNLILLHCVFIYPHLWSQFSDSLVWRAKDWNVQTDWKYLFHPILTFKM